MQNVKVTHALQNTYYCGNMDKINQDLKYRPILILAIRPDMIKTISILPI